MADIFLKIVNMGISASWIVLAVLVLRLLLKKAPKWIFVLLWGIVAVRLMCPFSMESVLSLIPSAETISPEIMMDWTPTIDTGIPVINNVVNPVISGSFAPEPMASANPLQILIPVAANIWVLGAVTMLLYTVVSYIRLRRKICTAVLLRDNVYQCETVGSPFVLGVIKPKIYLPFGIGEQDTEYVIAHENAHIRRKDHLWKPIGFLLLSLYWFNPLMWLGYVLLCRDIELACDEKVVKNLSAQQKADYSQALLTCSVNRRMVAACPLAFGEVGVKKRVKSVLHYKKPAFWIILVAILASIAAAVCFLTNPVAKNTDTTKLLFAVLNNEKTFADESGGTTYLKDYKLSPTQTAATIPENYTLVDFDRDGVDELVVYITPYGGVYLVFHVDDDRVYGFAFGARELVSLKTDGSFHKSESAGVNRYATLSFEGGRHIIHEIVYDNDMDQEYTINGKPASAQSVDAMVGELSNKPDVTWYNCISGAEVKYRTLYASFWGGFTTAINSNGESKTIQEYLGCDPKAENSACYRAFYDVTGDGVEDLCVKKYPQQMYFFTVKNGQLYHWYTENNAYSKLLNNGEFLYERYGGAPTHIDYQYYELDANANETFRITFSWYDGKTVEQGKEYPDSYFINGQEVSKEEYEAKSKQYLEIGNDRIVWYDKDGNIQK